MTTPDEFLQAIKTGAAAQVQAALAEQPALAVARTDSGVSALLLSIYYNEPALAQLLLSTGLTLDLFEAAAAGQLERAAQLLDGAPAAVNDYATDGFTALGLAAYFGHPTVVSLLLDRGADPHLAARNPMQVQPLHSAVAHRDQATACAIAEILLRRGANVNAQQEGGFTPLHEAAFHGDETLVRLLLAHGADPKLANTAGQPPSELAAKNGHAAVATLLELAGQDS